MNLKIIDYYYYDNEVNGKPEYCAPVLNLVCMDEATEFHLIKILDKEKLTPRFGVLSSELDEMLPILSGIEGMIPFKIEDGVNSLYKEETKNLKINYPHEIYKIRKAFKQTFQANIKWEKLAMAVIINELNLRNMFIEVPSDYIYRFLKVSDIKQGTEFYAEDHVCYWDIEADGRPVQGKMKYEDYKNLPIISISTYDNYKKEYHIFIHHPDFEEDMDEEFWDYPVWDNVANRIIILKHVFRHEIVGESNMLKRFFTYFADQKFHRMFGYWSAGGIKKGSFGKEKGKKKKKRKWFDGFDLQCLYERSKKLELLEDMQKMSSCPIKKKHYGNSYEGVSLRTAKNKHQVVIKGIGQIDFVISADVIQFHQKYYDFRGSRLGDWMAYFTDCNKLDKRGKHVWYYWTQEDLHTEDLKNSEKINGVPRVKNKGLEFIMDYNLIDVKGCVDLDARFNVSKNQAGRTYVSISPFEDALNASKLHTHYKISRYMNRLAFDTKYQNFKRERRNGKKQVGDKFTISLKELERQASERTGTDVVYESLDDIHKVGGFVPKAPPVGIYEWIAVPDFSKFYPNMIKTCNIGIVSAVNVKSTTESTVRDVNGKIYLKSELIETPIGYYRKDVTSLNKEIFDDWMVKRVEAQKKVKEYLKIHKTTKTPEYKLLWSEQFNLKNFMNSAFGILGLEVDINYSEMDFNSCTCSCQDVIMMVISKFDEWGVERIGGDTDSVFIKLKSRDLESAKAEGNLLCERINKCIEKYMKRVYNVDTNSIEMGLETISDKFYVDSKKHYIKRNLYVDGVTLEVPELEIKGMDLKKRATSALAAQNQVKMIDTIFEEFDPMAKIKEYILEIEENIQNYKWSFVCKRGAINKDLKEYPDSNESANAARNTYKYLGKYYEPGSNPFIGVFSEYPPQFNGVPINEIGDFKMSFDEEDEKQLKEAGFILNYDHIRETECNAKTENLLSMFNEDWYSIHESAELGDFCDA